MNKRSDPKRQSMTWYQGMSTYFAVAFLLVFGRLNVSYAQTITTTIRGLPFSANEWVTRTSPAVGGTFVVTTQQIAIARASDGTIRREIHEASAGTDRVVGRSIVLVSILNQSTKTNSAIFRGRAVVTAMGVPWTQDVPKATATKNVTAQPAKSSAGTEGTSINGLQTLVYRSQYSVPASDPNAKANTVTSEIWYSPELHVTLKSSMSESSGAMVVSTLTDIYRQEPDSSLFHVDNEAKTIQK
jgi:hypothetical protein